MNTIDADQAINFLSTVFEGAPEGIVWLTPLSLDRDGEGRSLADRDAAQIENFVTTYNALERSTYFCPSALRVGASGRDKETVEWLTGVHCDIDYKEHDTAPADIWKAIPAYRAARLSHYRERRRPAPIFSIPRSTACHA
jgi:hypothetical protein